MLMRDTITDTTTIVVYDTITYRKPVAVDSVVVRYKTIHVELKEDNFPNKTVTKLPESVQKLPESVQKFPESDQNLQDSVPNFGKTVPDSANVVIPITQKTYKDSTYTAWVSGYDPSLDSIQVYPKTEYKTITNTIKMQDTKRWGIGIQGGVGYGKGGFTPYIGIGVQYNIIRW
jgi:hypothetical protein